MKNKDFKSSIKNTTLQGFNNKQIQFVAKFGHSKTILLILNDYRIENMTCISNKQSIHHVSPFYTYLFRSIINPKVSLNDFTYSEMTVI